VPENEQLRQAWKEANDLVRAAEDRLNAAWGAFAAGRAGPPSKEMLDEVARLRRECDKRLAAILDKYPSQGKPSARTRAERPNS